jgi:hypothetical protein
VRLRDVALEVRVGQPVLDLAVLDLGAEVALAGGRDRQRRLLIAGEVLADVAAGVVSRRLPSPVV